MNNPVLNKMMVLRHFGILDNAKPSQTNALKSILKSCQNETQMDNVLHDVLYGNETLEELLARKEYKNMTEKEQEINKILVDLNTVVKEAGINVTFTYDDASEYYDYCVKRKEMYENFASMYPEFETPKPWYGRLAYGTARANVRRNSNVQTV